MTVNVTMLDTRMGEDGTVWESGTTQEATATFASQLVHSGWATVNFDRSMARSTVVALMGDSLTARTNQLHTGVAVSCVDGVCTASSISPAKNFAPGEQVWLYGKYGSSIDDSFKGLKTVLTRISNVSITYAGDPDFTGSTTGVALVNYGQAGEMGYGTFLKGLIDNRARVVNCAQGGATSAEILEFVPYVLEAFNPDIVIEWSGANDAVIPVSAGIMVANRSAIWDAMHAAGKKVFAAYVAGRDNVTHSVITEYNAALTVAMDSRPWLERFDPYSLWIDGTSATGANRSDRVYSDGTHPLHCGSLVVAQQLYTLLDKHLPARTATVASNYQVAGTDANSTNIMPNPMFAGTGGTVTAGSGTAADDVTLESTSLVSNVASVIANAYGPGNAQRVVCTSDAVNDAGGFAIASVHASLPAAGTLMRVRCRATLAAGATALRTISLRFTITASVTYQYDLLLISNITDAAAYSLGFDGLLFETHIVVPAVAVTAAVFQARLIFNGTGSATLDVAEVSCEQVESLVK